MKLYLDGSLAEVKTTMAEVKAKCEAPNAGKSCKHRDSLRIPVDTGSRSRRCHLRCEIMVKCVVVVHIVAPAGGSPTSRLHHHVLGGARTEESGGTTSAERVARYIVVVVTVS